jgi:hypothetical protein
MNMPRRSGASQQHSVLQDVDLAKSILTVEKLSLAIVKENKTIFTSKESGVKGLVDAISKQGSSLHGAAVADRVLGKAAALLCVYAKLSAVHAFVMSRLGEEVLKRHSIPFQHDTLVPNILNQHGTDMCAFERIVLETDSPKEAFLMISHRLATGVSREA